MVTLSSLRIRTTNRSPVSQISSMFISLMLDVREPTHYLERIGHEVPGSPLWFEMSILGFLL